MDTRFTEFLKLESLADTPSIECLNTLGSMVNAASDEGHSECLKHAIELAEKITVSHYTDEHQTLLDFFIANAWSGLKQLRCSEAGGDWAWEQLEIEKELFHLRRARRSSGFAKFPAIRRCPILTNEGNCLDNLGRFVEAIAPWNMALTIDSDFGMASGNRGIGLWTYARQLYDENQRMIIANAAWRELNSARSLGVDRYAAYCFQKYCEEIESIFHADMLKHEFDLNAHQIGSAEDERNYRQWCLDRCLFLNPINDLGAFNAAANDVLTCPSVVTSINEGPIFHGFFNQMKQEFCSARWLAYEGIMLPAQHFSDTDVLLYNTLDYPSYSLSTEKLKLAFRALYSLFDKIAFFLNAYLKLNIPENRVIFRSLWYERPPAKNRPGLIREQFKERQNLPFRGLFWLAKDLYESRDEFLDVMDPDARLLREVRNQLEHKYLKLHEDLWRRPESESGDTFGFTDSLAYSLTRVEFEKMVYRLLSLSRAALIYLALGVHNEELTKSQSLDPNSHSVPIQLEPWEDDWKL